MKQKLVVECRSTGRGADTHVESEHQDIEMIEFDTSKTGNHWSVAISGPTGASFTVIDISNSGKHNCWKGTLTDDGYIVSVRDGRPCAICT